MKGFSKMSKQTQNSSFKREDKSQLGAEGDAVIIGPTFMQNYSREPKNLKISTIFRLHRDQFNTELAYLGTHGTKYA